MAISSRRPPQNLSVGYKSVVVKCNITSTYPALQGQAPRSHTRPLQMERQHKHKRTRAKTLDAKELCQRLEALRLEMRRDATRDLQRAEKPFNHQHYVPQVAATDFARTATPHPSKPKDTHKLSRAVTVSYALGVTAKYPPQNGRPQKRAGRKSLDIDALAERNQFQRTPAMEAAAQFDKARDAKKPRSSSFNMNTLMSQPDLQGHLDKDSDTWDSLHDDVNVLASRTRHAPPQPNDRADWTQSDERIEELAERRHHLFSPLVRQIAKRLHGSEREVSCAVDDGEDVPDEKRMWRRKSSLLNRGPRRETNGPPLGSFVLNEDALNGGTVDG